MSISWETLVAKNETQEFSTNPVINKKVKKAVSGLPKKYVQKYFINDITRGKDKELAADFITSCMNQEPCKPSTRRIYTLAFAYLCRYLADKKIDVSLDQVTADTLYDYITNFRPAAAAEEEGEGETTTTTTMTTTPPTAKRAKSKAVEKEEEEETVIDEEETRLLQQQQEYESWKTTQKPCAIHSRNSTNGLHIQT